MRPESSRLRATDRRRGRTAPPAPLDSGPEALDQQAVAEAAIAHGERLLAQLLHHRPDDAGAGEDDVGSLRLEPDDRPARLDIARPVELDLAVDLGPVEDAALDDVRVVRGQGVLHRGDVRDRAAHRHQRVGSGATVDPGEVAGDRGEGVGKDLARIDGRPAPDALVAMGGAVTNITAVKHGLAVYDPDVVQGTVLDRAEIDRQIELYRSRDVDARRGIVGLQPKRADVILAGACIVRTVMEKLGQETLTVSDRGLRHGVLVERFGA